MPQNAASAFASIPHTAVFWGMKLTTQLASSLTYNVHSVSLWEVSNYIMLLCSRFQFELKYEDATKCCISFCIPSPYSSVLGYEAYNTVSLKPYTVHSVSLWEVSNYNMCCFVLLVWVSKTKMPQNAASAFAPFTILQCFGVNEAYITIWHKLYRVKQL